jgi:hypothetical protein
METLERTRSRGGVDTCHAHVYVTASGRVTAEKGKGWWGCGQLGRLKAGRKKMPFVTEWGTISSP